MSQVDLQAECDGTIEAITTENCGDDVLECHLERALACADSSEARFHIRQALQLLNECETGRRYR